MRLRNLEKISGGRLMSYGIFGNAFERDDEDELFVRGYIPGLGLVLPVLGLEERDLIVRRNLDVRTG